MDQKHQMSQEHISVVTTLLVHFDLVCRCRGLRATAKKMGIPLTRLSRSIDQLENILERKLIYSDCNTFSLTKEGERLRREVDVSGLLVKLNYEFQQYQSRQTLKLHVAPQVKAGICGDILSQYAEKILDSRISVMVSCESLEELEIHRQLQVGDLDVVLSYHRFSSRSIENRHIYTDCYAFYMHKEHFQAGQKLGVDIHHLATLSSGTELEATHFIADLFSNTACDELGKLSPLLLPDIESLCCLSKSVPSLLLLNRVAKREFEMRGIELQLVKSVGEISIPVYLSYHKANPRQKMFKAVAENYLEYVGFMSEPDPRLKTVS